MATTAVQVVSDVGNRLARQPRPNKDFLVKSLRQASSALSELDQSSSLESTIKPLIDSLVKHSLFQHKDKDVRLLVAICATEIIRVLAPEPPFSDEIFRDIFKLSISMFAELADTTSPYFSRRVKILETIATLQCCLLMLDIGCNDLVLEMFKTFFSIVRENHQQSLVNAMLSIMTLILKEKVTQPLVDLILQNLLKEGKGASEASSQLAVSVIQDCAEQLEPFVRGFLTSCILDRDAVASELKEFYHEIIFEIFRCAPQILLAVIPNLTQELLTDQVDVRIKALNLTGKLLALPEHHVAQEYRQLFIEFLKRFSDKSTEVRVSALQCARACYTANPSRTESLEILTALEGRVLDFDDRVRTQAVIVACDLAKSNLKFVPHELLSRTTERLRDKKVSVRKITFQKLLEVYRDYCLKCSEGLMTISENLEQIPCRILMLCYDKDCKEFRPQNMELVLAEDLFPASLSLEERTRHWITLFSLFTPPHFKSLNSILSQKRRLQTEMQIYLALRRKEKEKSSEEEQKRINTSFKKMSASFPDPSRAEECFHKLNQMKDNSIFTTLALLLDEVKATDARITRDKFLKMIGNKHPHFEFLKSLSMKCLYNIFSSEHVRYILDDISNTRFQNKDLEASSLNLLLAIISIFPSLLRGSEEQFKMLLLAEDNQLNEKLIQILAKAAPQISIKLSDVYPSLEMACLHGTRTQSKFAVSAIASLIGTSEQFIFTELCKKLVDALYRGQNIPTVLQSLGCIAQHCISAFETHDREITRYINNNVLRPMEMEPSYGASLDDTSSCKLKIYALKTLVKSFLPHRGTHGSRHINELLDILSKLLQNGEASDNIISRDGDAAKIRLASSKSVLRLSRRWDLHITPHIFRSTVLMAKDSSAFVRRSFLDKTHKLLKERSVPSRYACAFALAATDCLKDLQDDSLKYMTEFIKEYSREARIRQTSLQQGGSMTDYPAYLVVFLVHVLAHDMDFPPENCRDEEIFAQFCCPLVFVLKALVSASYVDGDMDIIHDAVSYLLNIFRAIKKAEDAVDSQITSKLHILSDIGISLVNALNRNGISSSRTSGLILLPSSLYRAKNPKEASSNGLQPCFDENFVKRVIHISESHLSQEVNSHAKRGRKCQDDTLQPDNIPSGPLNMPRGQVETSKTKEGKKLHVHGTETRKLARRENSSMGRRKQDSPSAAPEPVELDDESLIVEEQEEDASKNSEPIVEFEQLLSSCDSANVKMSLVDSQVSTYMDVDLAEDSSILHPHREPVVHSPLQSVKKTIPLPANAKKGAKVSKDTSVSEVIHVNEDAIARRTRRRKL